MTAPYFKFDRTNTLCISLETNHERWRKMQRRFESTGLDVTKFPASISSNPDDITDTFESHLNSGQKGCAQSHINIWRHIQSKPELPYALILEDDACFDKEWRANLEQFSIHLPHALNTFEVIMLNASEPIEPRDTWMQVTNQFLTGGYIVSQRGIKAILERFHTTYATSDWMMSQIQLRGNSYSYFPWLIIQEGNESTIDSCVEEDHKKVIRCLSQINYSMDNYVV